MELEYKNGIYAPRAPEIKDELARWPAWCARYARIVSVKLLTGKEKDNGRLWTPKNGWDFRYDNRVVWSIDDEELDMRKLKEGQIVGIRIPFSSFNERRDERKNLVRYSHLATIIGHFYDGREVVPWVAHNVYGVGDPESLPKFLRRTGSVLMEVFSPKDESVLKNKNS